MNKGIVTGVIGIVVGLGGVALTKVKHNNDIKKFDEMNQRMNENFANTNRMMEERFENFKARLNEKFGTAIGGE
jgi:chaperonin cofactor prefoldin